VPAHTAILDNGLITGVGLMLIVKVMGALVHPFFVAVTVTVEEITRPVLFTGAAYELILPDPLAARPTAILELVQLKVSPPPVLAENADGVTA